MRIEYLKHCYRGRGPERDRSWTGQEFLFENLMGLHYDLDEDFRREFNRSLETYRRPGERDEYEPRLLQEVWRDRELKYLISDECPPELVRRIVTSRTDWDNSESGEVRWDESRKRAAQLLESDNMLHEYLSAERSNYVIDNLLGSYEPQSRKVSLYNRTIRLAARELGVDEDSVSTVVYVHESVHAYSHIGRDLVNRMWDGCPALVADSPEEQINQPQEAIAQYYTYKLLESLGDDRLLKTFLALEKASSPVYRAWRQTEHYSLEQMRAVLIQYRSGTSDWPPVH